MIRNLRSVVCIMFALLVILLPILHVVISQEALNIFLAIPIILLSVP